MSNNDETMETDAAAQMDRKRVRNVLVDPDTSNTLTDTKRPRIELDKTKKVKVLTLIIKSFTSLAKGIFKDSTIVESAVKSINVSIQIANIIFTLHTYERQTILGRTKTNILTKANATDFSVRYREKDFSISRKDLASIWLKEVENAGLKYEKFGERSVENWYGTFGPYIDFICGFGLRMRELRVGHSRMPVTKDKDGAIVEFKTSTYGLSGAHHILLEGCTFPPEKRSSMAQSIGPMTSMICMLRSKGQYREKWAAATKRAFSHIPIIDDIIQVTATHNMASEVSGMVGLLAEIALITTTRQATRMFFPLCMLNSVYKDHKTEADKQRFLEHFTTTNKGGFYTYKQAIKHGFHMNTTMSAEAAGQIVFHSIFGTYKEDLSILSEITGVANWKTREEIGSGFVKPEKEVQRVITMPALLYYSKMSSANQTGLMASQQQQVSSIPAFSGPTERIFHECFFEQLEKKISVGSTGKTIQQITASLSVILSELKDKLLSNRCMLKTGTTSWHSSHGLTLTEDGPVEATKIFRGKGHYLIITQNVLAPN